jgi:hypothetical protein
MNAKTCPQCEAELLNSARTCHACGYEFIEQEPEHLRGHRPGFVTAYALITGIGAGLLILADILFGVFFIPGSFGVGASSSSDVWVSLLCAIPIALGVLVIGVLYLLLVRGLWRLKRWARTTTIVLHCLSVPTSLILAFGILALADVEVEQEMRICGVAVVQTVVSSLILYWFASHGEYFD